MKIKTLDTKLGVSINYGDKQGERGGYANVIDTTYLHKLFKKGGQKFSKSC